MMRIILVWLALRCLVLPRTILCVVPKVFGLISSSFIDFDFTQSLVVRSTF